MKKSRQMGFSLLEMSLVLVILGLLLSAFLSPLQGYAHHKRMFEACDEIARIRQALLDFTVVHGRLPWAAQANGMEVASKAQGLLAWRTLGLRPQNVWGEAYRYHVMSHWADQKPDPVIVGRCDIQESLNHLSVNFCSTGGLQVRRNNGEVFYDKAVVIVTQPRATDNKMRVCEPGLTWLSAENVLGYLVLAGRLH